MDLKERLDQFTENVETRYILAGLLIVVGLVLVAGAQLGLQPSDKPVEGNRSDVSDNGSTSTLQVNLTINYGGSVDGQTVNVENGTSVFGVLNATYNVSYRTSSYGYFITAIEGESGTSDEYWTYQVNGESPKVGAGQYKLNRSSSVTFTLS